MNPDQSMDLIEAARAAAGLAYATYSKFQVGAALRASDGRIFSGCNVENASYGLTICAERNAVWSAVAHGCRSFSAIAIFTFAEEPTPPCGACRQVLYEFSPDLEILIVNPAGLASRHTLSQLLPLAFGPQHFQP
jgi:cytidine deaminase